MRHFFVRTYYHVSFEKKNQSETNPRYGFEGEHMTNTQKTDPKLLNALKAAAGRKLSAEKMRRQKISFIMGTLGQESTVTRDRVEEELKKMEGSAA
jgi:hypothetical protein